MLAPPRVRVLVPVCVRDPEPEMTPAKLLLADELKVNVPALEMDPLKAPEASELATTSDLPEAMFSAPEKVLDPPKVSDPEDNNKLPLPAKDWVIAPP